MHIFISYSKKDTRELAFALADALNALPDITAWVDRSLRAGPSWETQIQSEILKCDYFVALYSPDINRHLNGDEESYVLNEISYAKQIAKKPIIPIMAKPTDPPMSLVTAQYIDFTFPGMSFNDLVNAIYVEVSGSVSQGVSSLEFLPAPFAWIDIPGLFGKNWKGKPYKVAKYPVTNGQYRRFVEGGGYVEKRWWTHIGWNAREQGRWQEPQHWTNVNWNDDEQPVVGVSWYEAVAYCTWLSEMTRESIMLPTVGQWQYAAQGDDGTDYPWGTRWDASRCNNNVDNHGIGKTRPVQYYEGKGNSIFGVVDMVGNVWEWCQTASDQKTETVEGTHDRIICGGSWNSSNLNSFYSSSRRIQHPVSRHTDLGFRLVRT